MPTVPRMARASTSHAADSTRIPSGPAVAAATAASARTAVPGESTVDSSRSSSTMVRPASRANPRIRSPASS